MGETVLCSIAEDGPSGVISVAIDDVIKGDGCDVELDESQDNGSDNDEEDDDEDVRMDDDDDDDNDDDKEIDFF